MRVIGYINDVPLDKIPLEEQMVLFEEMMKRAGASIGKKYIGKTVENNKSRQVKIIDKYKR